MRRRDFLKSTGLVTTSMLMPGFLRAMASGGSNPSGRVLVVLQLSGGNDGLNTFVPYRDDAYYRDRPGLALHQERLLKLDDRLGLHPALKSIRGSFEQGSMCVINGVGYPNPDRSHFRSMDIWHTASASNEHLGTGWLGRFLDAECERPHEVLEVGSRLSLANRGEVKKAICLTDPARFIASTRQPYFARLASGGAPEAGPALGYLYKTMAETYQSAAYIEEKLRPARTGATYPRTELGTHLQLIADLVRAGMETRVYYASISGFDTHSNQAGRQERALGQVDAALGSFTADLRSSGLMDRVTVMVFSEFGRRVKQNASGGTDHGTAGNIWIMGGGVKQAGAFNPPPSLADLDDNGDLRHTVDFRNVYATLLRDWLATDPSAVLAHDATLLRGLIG